MCYDIAIQKRRELKLEHRYGKDPEKIKLLEEELRTWSENNMAKYYASGFDHPLLPVRSNLEPTKIQGFEWGLIPSGTSNLTEATRLSTFTLNARSEDMFVTKSYKEPARFKRCVIYVDSFFEHHHQGIKRTYPFVIRKKDHTQMALAGLWDSWTDPQTGEVHKTTAIVTTRANEALAIIHNGKRAQETGPRMPVILPGELEDSWLKPFESEDYKRFFHDLCLAYPFDLLEYYSVLSLKGKNGVGNSMLALEPYLHLDLLKIYAELPPFPYSP